MALKTLIQKIDSYSTVGGVINSVFMSIGFEYEATTNFKYMYGKYTDAIKSNYIGFYARDMNSADGYLTSRIDGKYHLTHAIEAINNMRCISAAWDDDFLTIHAVSDTGFPSEKTASGDNVGLYIAKSGDTWVAGIVYSTGSELQNGWNAWKIVSADDRSYPTDDAQYSVFALNYATEVMETLPCVGRSKLCPDKVSLISATPESRIASSGWITLNDREYYKNGIFLIDAER